MKKSNIAQGQMFIQFPQPIPELQDTPKPRVWVKVSDADFETEDGGVSLFVDNRSLVLLSIGQLKRLSIRDKWYISDIMGSACVRESSCRLMTSVKLRASARNSVMNCPKKWSFKKKFSALA